MCTFELETDCEAGIQPGACPLFCEPVLPAMHPVVFRPSKCAASACVRECNKPLSAKRSRTQGLRVRASEDDPQSGTGLSEREEYEGTGESPSMSAWPQSSTGHFAPLATQASPLHGMC